MPHSTGRCNETLLCAAGLLNSYTHKTLLDSRCRGSNRARLLACLLKREIYLFVQSTGFVRVRTFGVPSCCTCTLSPNLLWQRLSCSRDWIWLLWLLWLFSTSVWMWHFTVFMICLIAVMFPFLSAVFFFLLLMRGSLFVVLRSCPNRRSLVLWLSVSFRRTEPSWTDVQFPSWLVNRCVIQCMHLTHDRVEHTDWNGLHQKYQIIYDVSFLFFPPPSHTRGAGGKKSNSV